MTDLADEFVTPDRVELACVRGNDVALDTGNFALFELRPDSAEVLRFFGSPASIESLLEAAGVERSHGNDATEELLTLVEALEATDLLERT